MNKTLRSKKEMLGHFFFMIKLTRKAQKSSGEGEVPAVYSKTLGHSLVCSLPPFGDDSNTNGAVCMQNCPQENKWFTCCRAVQLVWGNEVYQTDYSFISLFPPYKALSQTYVTCPFL